MGTRTVTLPGGMTYQVRDATPQEKAEDEAWQAAESARTKPERVAAVEALAMAVESRGGPAVATAKRAAWIRAVELRIPDDPPPRPPRYNDQTYCILPVASLTKERRKHVTTRRSLDGKYALAKWRGARPSVFSGYRTYIHAEILAHFCVTDPARWTRDIPLGAASA